MDKDNNIDNIQSDQVEENDGHLLQDSLKKPNFLRSLWQPITWKEQLLAFIDPYQFAVCHMDSAQVNQGISGNMLYERLLYLLREWKWLQRDQISKVLALRDSMVLSFEGHKHGFVAAIFNNSIYFHDKTGYNANSSSSNQQLEKLDNYFELRFLVPSPRFNEILIGATRNNLILLRKKNNELTEIKRYQNINAEKGAFSRDGKYFVAGNGVSSSIQIIDLFSHTIYSRNTGLSGISSVKYSPSGLHALCVSSDNRNITIFESVLWEKQTFDFKKTIAFCDFITQSDEHVAPIQSQYNSSSQSHHQQQISGCATGIWVVFTDGEIKVLRDMQFNTLTNDNTRINYQIIEAQSSFVQNLPSRFVYTEIIQNILFFLGSDDTQESNELQLGYVQLSGLTGGSNAGSLNTGSSRSNQAISSTIIPVNVQLNEETKFSVAQVKHNTYNMTFYNFSNSQQPIISINLQVQGMHN